MPPYKGFFLAKMLQTLNTDRTVNVLYMCTIHKIQNICTILLYYKTYQHKVVWIIQVQIKAHKPGSKPKLFI